MTTDELALVVATQGPEAMRAFSALITERDALKALIADARKACGFEHAGARVACGQCHDTYRQHAKSARAEVAALREKYEREVRAFHDQCRKTEAARAATLEEAARALEHDAALYLDNAKQCDAGDNHFGGAIDTACAEGLARMAGELRALATAAKPGEPIDALETGRHRNAARDALGEVYRHRLGKDGGFPEVGVVEVTRATNALARAYAEVDALRAKLCEAKAEAPATAQWHGER